MPTTTPASFESFFQTATTVWPYKYQVRLATTHPFPDVLDVPTGLGKTAAVVLGWLWQRRGHRDKLVRQATPRRLVYCLPMRVLVEQTFGETIRWLHRLGCLDALPGFDPDGPAGWKDYCPRPHAETADKIAVHLLMGGEPRRDWDLFPERDAILIGTQDMLLSRALNRGYGMSRFRWPMHFGMLGNDCLWVMDEVQLMGSGLGTTVQVDLFQKKFWPPQQPCHFLWMSATLGQSLLRTRDREDLGLAKIEPNRLFALEGTEKQEPAVRERLTAEKQIEVRKDAPSIRKRDGSGVLDRHQADRITLVILNTVPVAQGWFRQLRAVLASESKDEGASPPEVILLHSRFRPPDRQRQLESLQRFVDQQTREMGTVEGHLGLIIVSTQVIEAGIDLSSIRLWSEIAPWASVVQRLGRLNREGKQDGATAMFWMPGGTEENDKGAPNESKKKRERIGPYLKKDLETARKLLDSVRLRMEQNGEGRPYREALDEVLQTEESQKALEV
ncbi:MAG: DEAD/DEAH box helicase, partial [Planctomycetes bacterium]|nr:DEAD/DEAH box helicase [Planctomycetota bacterium]